jgi:hypothetical protein
MVRVYFIKWLASKATARADAETRGRRRRRHTSSAGITKQYESLNNLIILNDWPPLSELLGLHTVNASDATADSRSTC